MADEKRGLRNIFTRRKTQIEDALKRSGVGKPKRSKKATARVAAKANKWKGKQRSAYSD